MPQTHERRGEIGLIIEERRFIVYRLEGSKDGDLLLFGEGTPARRLADCTTEAAARAAFHLLTL